MFEKDLIKIDEDIYFLLHPDITKALITLKESSLTPDNVKDILNNYCVFDSKDKKIV